MATLNAHTFSTRDIAEAHYLGLVDVWAAEKRRIDPAQEAIYRRKSMEAEAGAGSLIEAEAIALGIEKSDLCLRINAASAEKERLWSDIEIQRITAKSNIRNAATAANMHSIYQQLTGED